MWIIKKCFNVGNVSDNGEKCWKTNLQKLPAAVALNLCHQSDVCVPLAALLPVSGQQC